MSVTARWSEALKSLMVVALAVYVSKVVLSATTGQVTWNTIDAPLVWNRSATRWVSASQPFQRAFVARFRGLKATALHGKALRAFNPRCPIEPPDGRVRDIE